VVISCASPDDVTAEPKKQLVLDFVTDKVIETLNVSGKLYVSPDLRNLVVLGNMGHSVSAFTIADDGIIFIIIIIMHQFIFIFLFYLVNSRSINYQLNIYLIIQSIKIVTLTKQIITNIYIYINVELICRLF